MKQSKGTNKDRRNFLRKVAVAGGAAGVGGVALGVLHSSPGAGNRKDDPRENTPSGYRLTEHIRTYYEKARI